jgi:hypothetical protein
VTDELTTREHALLAQVESLLSDARTWDEPGPEFEDHLVAAIGAEARGEATTQYRVVQPVSRRRRWLALGAAAAVGAAAATVVAVLVTRDREPAPEATVAMEGTALAPSLSGSAAFSTQPSGVEIEIHMPGLPRRDGGEYYQLWMHNCSGSAWVPAGTFHDMDYVVAWAGVAASDYPVLNVTEEAAGSPNGDGQASSGRVVAWGSLVECTA